MIYWRELEFQLKQPFQSFGQWLTHKKSLELSYRDISSEYSLYPGLTPPLGPFEKKLIEIDFLEILKAIENRQIQTLADFFQNARWAELKNQLPQATHFCLEILAFKLLVKLKSSDPIIQKFALSNRIEVAQLITNFSVPAINTGTLKIKMGRAKLNEEWPKLKIILDQTQGLVRIDPNEAWDMATLEQFIDQIETYAPKRLEYIESPLPYQQMLNLQDHLLPFMAIDLRAEHEFELGQFGHLILKPSLLSLSFFMSLCTQKALQPKIILSSLFEGPKGLEDLARLANLLESNKAHGLGTLGLFQGQVSKPFLEIPRLN